MLERLFVVTIRTVAVAYGILSILGVMVVAFYIPTLFSSVQQGGGVDSVVLALYIGFYVLNAIVLAWMSYAIWTLRGSGRQLGIIYHAIYLFIAVGSFVATQATAPGLPDTVASIVLFALAISYLGTILLLLKSGLARRIMAR
jgi:hypothetical protein